LVCSNRDMTDRPASWRMPTRKQKPAAQAARSPAPTAATPDAPLSDEYWDSLLKDSRAGDGVRMRQRKLSEIQRHVLRVSCRRCERTVEIQTADAVRLYEQRLLDNTCQQRTGRYEEDGCWPGVREFLASWCLQKSFSITIARAMEVPISFGHALTVVRIFHGQTRREDRSHQRRHLRYRC
jgi:hypothetical protein